MLQSLKNLPDKPGIYQYFDDNGRLLYVGKAKSLKKRVRSYFRMTPKIGPAPNLGARISMMICKTARIETIVTATESDALLLENSLIKQLKPKYNILLRDDKTYPYIYIDLSEPFPRLEMTRRVVKGKKVKYFGPFPTGARDILASIYELVPLVQKKGCLKGKKACLFHQIGRCLAPCEGKVDPKEYYRHIEEALMFIHNKKRLVAKLKEKMSFYAEGMRFEEAAAIRDRIERIEKIEDISGIDIARAENLDIFAISCDETSGVVVRLFMREGKIVSTSHTYFTPYDGIDIEEIYRRTILEFYGSDTPFTAKAVLTAHPLKEASELSALLSIRAGRNIEIQTPVRGAKKRLVELGVQNAKELLKLQKSRPKSQLPEKIAELLGLDEAPTRVEIFDNSHLMGKACVGAMVVFDKDGWERESYRHYNLNAKDEYGQMREMLSRRISSFESMPPPDLWLLDGGETLRELAVTLLESAGVNLPVVAIAKEKLDAKAHRAKGAAKDILYTSNAVLKLLPSDTRLQWFQRLRDEAHRFAITFHKKQRLKEQKEVSLLEVEGIGPAKVKKLLNYFGSFEEIRKSDLDSLKTVLSEKDAKTLHLYLKKIPI